MKIKSLLSRMVLLLCVFFITNLSMGMIKEKSLAQQFAEIRNNLPAQAISNLQLSTELNNVRIVLEQSQPDFARASSLLENMKQRVKSINFATDFGTLNGDELISVYFGDFINQLNKKITAPQPFALEFAEIRKKIPQNAAQEMNNDLNKAAAALQQSNLILARNTLRAIQNGPLKNKTYNTPDFGPITGANIIDMNFGDFITKLDAKIKALPKPAPQPQKPLPPVKPVTPVENPTELTRKFAETLERLPETGKNIPTLRQQLMAVQNILLQPQPRLNDALIALKKIKESAFLKNNQFEIPLLGSVPGEQFFSLYFDNFIKMLEMEIQAAQPHIAGRPYGLINRSNSCFMNSSIQALASLEKITNLLLKQPNDYYLPDSTSALYVQLLGTMQTEKRSTLDPLPFCLQGWKLMPDSKVGEQQDAAEFVQLLLQALTSDDINPARNPQKINKDLISLVEIKIREGTYDENSNPLTKKDEHYLIHPPINIEPNNKTLLNCLQNYFGIEHHPLRKNELKITSLVSTSNYLLIRLRRTGWSEISKKPFKNEQAISFELDNFDISSLSITGEKFSLYRCKAFIAHSGGATVGHYIAYIRMNNNWYICDDTNVIPVSLDEVRKFAHAGTFKASEGSLYTPLMFFYEQQ